MKKILLTGASGFLGWHIQQLAKNNCILIGTCHKNKTGSDLISVDITDYEALEELFQHTNPDAVIHAAAMTKPNECEEEPEISHKINVDASANIAGLCSDNGIPLLFTSSDLVFDGKNAPYKESDPTNPMSLYGEQKVKAEEKILSIYPQTLICRMPLMFGISNQDSSNHFATMINQIRIGKTVKLFADEFRTPVSGTTAAQALLNYIGQASGILHLGGRERISRFEMGMKAADIFGLSKAHILGIKQSELKMTASRPADVSLDSSKAFSLSHNPPTFIDELKKILALNLKTQKNL